MPNCILLFGILLSLDLAGPAPAPRATSMEYGGYVLTYRGTFRNLQTNLKLEEGSTEVQFHKLVTSHCEGLLRDASFSSYPISARR